MFYFLLTEDESALGVHTLTLTTNDFPCDPLMNTNPMTCPMNPSTI